MTTVVRPWFGRGYPPASLVSAIPPAAQIGLTPEVGGPCVPFEPRIHMRGRGLRTRRLLAEYSTGLVGLASSGQNPRRQNSKVGFVPAAGRRSSTPQFVVLAVDARQRGATQHPHPLPLIDHDAQCGDGRSSRGFWWVAPTLRTARGFRRTV